MTEYQQELVKEVLGEARKAKANIDYAFERLEALAARLLEKEDKDKKEEVPEVAS